MALTVGFATLAVPHRQKLSCFNSPLQPRLGNPAAGGGTGMAAAVTNNFAEESAKCGIGELWKLQGKTRGLARCLCPLVALSGTRDLVQPLLLLGVDQT